MEYDADNPMRTVVLCRHHGAFFPDVPDQECYGCTPCRDILWKMDKDSADYHYMVGVYILQGHLS